MADARGVMQRADRAVGLIVLEPDGLDRLHHRRAVKQRRQRVTSVVLALMLAAFAIMSLIRVFGVGRPAVPDSRPPITPVNVGSLEIAWTAHVGRGAAPPVVANGVVYEVGKNRLFAFSASCGNTGGSCGAEWVADAAGIYPPVVSGGVVYQATKDTLYAFASHCRSDGGSCAPTWQAGVGGFDGRPVVAGDAVLIRGPQSLYALSTSCGSGGTTCEPLWVARVPSYRNGGLGPIVADSGAQDSRIVVAGDTVYTTGKNTLYAFPLSCGSSGATCQPSWTWSVPPQGSGAGSDGGPVDLTTPFVVGGKVFVGGPDGKEASTWALASDCPNAHCGPLWVARHAGAPAGADKDTVYTDYNGTIEAFSSTCGAGGAICRPLWKAGHPFHDYGFVYNDQLVDNVLYESSLNQIFVFPPSCRTRDRICEPRLIRTGTNRDWSLAQVTDGVVYVYLGGVLSAFDAACGTAGSSCARLWKAPADDHGRPVVADGMLFSTSDGTLHAYSPGT